MTSRIVRHMENTIQLNCHLIGNEITRRCKNRRLFQMGPIVQIIMRSLKARL